jgi:hypothetical protein
MIIRSRTLTPLFLAMLAIGLNVTPALAGFDWVCCGYHKPEPTGPSNNCYGYYPTVWRAWRLAAGMSTVRNLVSSCRTGEWDAGNPRIQACRDGKSHQDARAHKCHLCFHQPTERAESGTSVLVVDCLYAPSAPAPGGRHLSAHGDRPIPICFSIDGSRQRFWQFSNSA